MNTADAEEPDNMTLGRCLGGFWLSRSMCAFTISLHPGIFWSSSKARMTAWPVRARSDALSQWREIHSEGGATSASALANHRILTIMGQGWLKPQSRIGGIEQNSCR